MNLVFKYLAIGCLSLLCYFQSLSGDFVFDDRVAIVKNQDVLQGVNNETIRVSFMNENIERIKMS